MANPQKENGYTQLANELLDALIGIRISGVENQCLWLIIRKTYGWQKKTDAIALSQFCSDTGLSKPPVVRAINNLLKKKVIIKDDTGMINKYGINKDFSSWVPLPKKITGYKKESTLKKFCYLCNFTEALVKHHLKPQSQGGSDRVENLIRLCPNCHALVHQGKIADKELLSKKKAIESVDNKDNQAVKKGVTKKIHTKDTTKDIKEIIDIKHKYGEFKNVLLTDTELKKLTEQYGKKTALDRIENLSRYVGSTGKVYKSHYITIKNWLRKEGTKAKTICSPQNPMPVNTPHKDQYSHPDLKEKREMKDGQFTGKTAKICENCGVRFDF